MLLKMTGSVPGNTKPGFGLLEIVIALAILGALTSLAVPNYLRQQAGYERKIFVTSLNAVMSEVFQQTLMTEKIGRVKLDFKQRTITVEQEVDDFDEEGKKDFKPVLLHYANANYRWPDSFNIKQFFINRKDEVAARGMHGDTDAVWFYVMPSGMAQEVIVNILDVKDETADNDGTEMSLVLNPFTLQFRVYHDFQIPSS
ncbi:MAG: prepilin-type N-terminal cleavage/methylation domain-containing protein [Alteromonas naphthalenivorans]|jgi:prepilin-type N-terminal cleavage/methylation domain-containing protein